jgi:hypothetical protein
MKLSFRVAFALGFLALFPALAHAQDEAPTCTASSPPTERFACAAFAAQEGLWEDALAQFQLLYEETHAPSALYNVAIAYQSLGRHRDARDAFDRLMRQHSAELDDETRAEAARQYGTEAARVARIELAGVPHEDSTVRVRLDGRSASVGDEEPLVLEADPGPHGVSVTQQGHEEFAWEGTLSDGQTLALAVLLPVLPAQPHELYEDAGFWVGMVLLAGAIAGGAVLGWWLQEDAQLDARGGFVIPMGS